MSGSKLRQMKIRSSSTGDIEFEYPEDIRDSKVVINRNSDILKIKLNGRDNVISFLPELFLSL